MESPTGNTYRDGESPMFSNNIESREAEHPEQDLEANSTPQPYAAREKLLPDDEDSYSNWEGDVQDYTGEDTQRNDNNGSRRPSVIERVQSQYSFFNEKLRENRKGLVLKFVLIYLIMSVGILSIFSIYWGSFYQRNSRLKNLNMLVVIEDDHTVDGIEPVIGNTLRELIESDSAKAYGNWHIYNQSEFQKKADKQHSDIESEVIRQVHHQNYWSSIYVKANASYNLYNAISNGDSSYNVTNNTILSYYETGRDFLSMNLYVTPSIKMVEQMWLKALPNVTLELAQNLPSSQRSDVLSDSNSLALVATPISFTYHDRIPYTDPVLTAPSQVGLIYMIIITFFQVNFFMDVHKSVSELKIKKSQFVLYRVLSSIFSFFVISFFFSIVTLAFQVDFNKAYGKSGFLVYWMITFITMWAVGLVNEVMALICVLVYPPLMGFWMLFWVIINIAPTFAPMALCPEFYRFGYAMPIHNSYEATKVVFFNTYKGNLGRNFGIIVVWVVIFTLLLPVMLKVFGQTMAKRAKAAAAAAAKDK